MTIVVNKLSAAVNTELKLLAQNILIAVVKDNNNKFWMLGKERGLDMGASESGSGTAFGDRSGYTLNFMGKEPVGIKVDLDSFNIEIIVKEDDITGEN